MDVKYEEYIRKIAKTIVQYYDLNDGSLLGGTAGVALFMYKAIKYGYSEDEDFLYKLLNKSTSSVEDGTFSLARGTAGIYWLIRYLIREKAINRLKFDDNHSINYLINGALMQLKVDNYDMLHGGVGVAYSMLYDFPENSNLDHCTFHEIDIEIERLFSGNSFHRIIFDTDSGTMVLNHKEVDMGLAHGLPGILKYLTQCYKKGINQNANEKLSERIIDYIVAHVNTDTSVSYFPNIVSDESASATSSRLAWCYGDLGVSYILYQSGLVLNENRLIDFALEILRNSTFRRGHKNTLVSDAGLCHGTSGIAHIYNRMWNYTYDPIFKNACDYWMQKTIEFSEKFGTNAANFPKYTNNSNAFVADFNLLEGEAGIGLCLISYITNDLDWDYCILLND